jgi:hypothetical protein
MRKATLKTFESFRQAGIERDGVGVRFASSDRVPAWAREAPTGEVRAWIDRVKDPTLEGDRVRCLALLAADRSRGGQGEEARALLTEAEKIEKARSKKDDSESNARVTSLTGLIPARWRVGDALRGNAGLDELVAADDDPKSELFVSQIVALAGSAGSGASRSTTSRGSGRFPVSLSLVTPSSSRLRSRIASPPPSRRSRPRPSSQT